MPKLSLGTRSRFFLLALCLLSLQSFAGQEKAASPEAMTIADHWSLPGIFGGGVKTNDAYTDGNLFLVFPAYSTIGTNGSLGGDVIFIEPYSSWGEEGEVAVSLGLGWRHLFSQQSTTAVTHHDGHQAGFFEEGAFIGANLFVDMLDTQFDNHFWQLGFGLEAGTRYLELHANYYLPLSDRQLALEQRSRQTFTSRSTSTQQDVAYGDPYATGHTIAQGALFTTTRTTVTTNTTIDRISRLFEDGMEGWEIESALLVPGLDRWMDVKILGGYYSYDNQPFGPQAGGTGNVEGWKAGVEVRPVPAVVLNATWYEDERLTGGDWVAGVRFELPFEAGDLGDGKGFWGRMGDAFRPRRRHLAERLIEPVRRQNAAVKVAASVEEEQKVTQVQHVTKVVSQTATQIVLANTVVFVDNAIGAPSNPGTYEAPLDTITHGKVVGNSLFADSAIVFVQGRPSPYPENVVILNQGVRLFGSGSFPAFGGKVFHGRTDLMPHLVGGFVAQVVPSTVAIVGFEITDGFSAGGVVTDGLNSVFGAISIQNVAEAIVAGNYIHAPDTQGSGAGIYVESTGPASVSQVLISNNVINGYGLGIVAGSLEFGRIDARIEYNLLSGISSNALDVSAGNGGSGTFLVNGNTVTNSGVGIQVAAFGGSGTFAITGNTTSANFNGISAVVGFGGTANVSLSDNTSTFNSNSQIFAQDVGGTLNFISTGTLSNDLMETPGDPDFLYNSFSGNPLGSIYINGFFHPASVDLP